MCFSNFHNHFGNMQVFLSFGVYYDGVQDTTQRTEEEKKKKEEISKDLNGTLSVIEVHAACCSTQVLSYYVTSRRIYSTQYLYSTVSTTVQ